MKGTMSSQPTSAVSRSHSSSLSFLEVLFSDKFFKVCVKQAESTENCHRNAVQSIFSVVEKPHGSCQYEPVNGAHTPDNFPALCCLL